MLDGLSQTLKKKTVNGVTSCDDGLVKLDATWLIVRTSTSTLLQQLQNIVVSLLQNATMLASYKAISRVAMS